MLILVETPAGYALFNVAKQKKLSSVDNILSMFESEESVNK